MAFGNSMHMLLDAIATSHFDLIMFGIGLMGYVLLSFSRKSYAAKEVYEKADITFDKSEELDEPPGVREPSLQLMQVLQSAENCDNTYVAKADIDAFLVEYPKYDFTLREVQTILDVCCNSVADKTLADRLLEHMQPVEEWHALNAFIQFYLESEQPGKACDVFELNYATFFDIELDEKIEWRLLIAALQCERQSLADLLLATAQSDVATHVVSIQNWWRRKSALMAEARVGHMGDVLNRLSNMFNERYPFEEQSDDESTCFLGDDSDREESSSSDCEWEEIRP